MPDEVTVFNIVPINRRLPPGYVNVEDAARYVGVSDETIRKYIQAGRLEAMRQRQAKGPGGWRWVIPTAQVNRLKRLRETQTP